MSNECCNNNCNQGRDCPERRVADRRKTLGAAFEEMDNAMAAALDAGGQSAEMVSLEDLCALLPGPYYMDPPDGGDTPVMEQLRRMAEDANKYRVSAKNVDRNSDGGEYMRAMEAKYPIPNSPHNSVVQRAIDNRLAFHNGWNAALTVAPQPVDAAQAVPFQGRVQPWMMACFGEMIAADVIERNHRFLEESLELVQACGCAADEAHQLVDYVFGRPVGERSQEVGGVMVTLAALCLAQGLDMHDAGEVELARIWTKVEQIRAKQAAKPQFSPLPAFTPSPAAQPAAQAVPELVTQLREYAGNPGYSHGDYADAMRQAADALDTTKGA